MNVEYLMMDASILLPPTGTPLTGIDFVKRLPCGDVERTRRVSNTIFLTFVHDAKGFERFWKYKYLSCKAARLEVSSIKTKTDENMKT